MPKINKGVIDYSDRKLDLETLNQSELKNISRHYCLHISGNKSVLKERIRTHFRKDLIIVLLQKMVRGYFVRLFFKLRKTAFKKLDLTKLVNDSDFYTMDPLDEIEFYNLYTYTDTKNFTYGFSIKSLISLYTKKGSLENPYNRSKFPLRIVLDIFSLYGMIKVIFGDQIDGPRIIIPGKWYFKRVNNRNRIYTETPSDRIQVETVSTDNVNNITTVNVSTNSASDNNFNNSVINQILNTRQGALLEIMNAPLYLRVEEIFIEIDLLGNYTRSEWFTRLTPVMKRIFYFNLKDIWNYKANILTETKRRIFPQGELFNPEYNEYSSFINLTDQAVLVICLTVMGKLVFSAIDREDRILATNLVLIALTTVSSDFRGQFPHLFDSIILQSI